MPKPRTTNDMFRKIQRTKAANAIAEKAAAAARRADPVEEAKLLLRRRGFNTYAESLSVPGSELFIVGSERMTAAQMVTKARELSK